MESKLAAIARLCCASRRQTDAFASEVRARNELGRERKMAERTSKLPHSLAATAGSRSTSTADRFVTVSGNVADGRHHHGRALPKYYAIQTVAEALDVSPRTVRRWIANGNLIAHRVDRVVRITDADLRAFLALHREG